jgi:hypothetical protein
MAITHEELKERLEYNPETGIFTWKRKTNRKSEIGSPAGSLIKGYIQIEMDRVSYRAHRLAWFWMTGQWPRRILDHKNRIRNDNRWENLREVTNSQNGQNAKTNIRNVSGTKGVCRHKHRGTWEAKVTINGRSFRQYFQTKEEAEEAVKIKRAELHGEFCHHG